MIGSLAFAVEGHGCFLRQGPAGHQAQLVSSGPGNTYQYVQIPSGAANNNTNSWEPATRDISAVGWSDSRANRPRYTSYTIDPNDKVEMSQDGSAYTEVKPNIYGTAAQLSAGLDGQGNPEVFILGTDGNVYVEDNTLNVQRNLPDQVPDLFKEISATVQN